LKEGFADLRLLIARKLSSSRWNSSEPVREELFSVERLEEHARSLAEAQAVLPKAIRGHSLAGRLADNGVVLFAAYRDMGKAIDDGRAITPAAEWLVDNYYLVERQIREIRSDLPPGYYRQLPKLAEGPFSGYPRVFGMAWAFVAHTDSHFDSDMLLRYVRAYQSVQPLTIGELWAISLTLRIVLIENLRRLAQQIVENRDARQQADFLADRLLGVAGQGAEPVPQVIMDYRGVRLPDAFAVQLVHRLRDQDPKVTPALKWLDRRLAAQDATVDGVVRDVHMDQGSSNVTMRNIITSLRTITDVDWNVLFEKVSLVDGILAEGSSFLDMDFPTRNLYRSAVEQLSRGSDRTELDIAKSAMLAAKASQLPDRKADPGYHLLAAGRQAFEASIGFRITIRQWMGRLNRRIGIAGYAVAILLVTVLVLSLVLAAMITTGLGLKLLCVFAVVGIVPAIDLAVAIVNRWVTFHVGPAALPAMELRDGIPVTLRTMVAVPAMLSSAAAIAELIERLEIHHLASGEGELYFALLTDWTDASAKQANNDTELLKLASDGIRRLNVVHGPAPGGDRFLLLHRRRQWSASEARWMGWERKRGKLHELNRLLRGALDTSFITLDGSGPLVPSEIRYVITLDADTRLPRDTVRRLIGKMAHPLNRPRFDGLLGRVVEGYAVLQPRVTPSLPTGRDGSLFQRIFSSLSGIDPYDSAVSDVYQDMFGEGSYAGKGIYDVDAFMASLAGRVPDSTLLSHDLFEGIFARAGLASDVEVVEDFPARYDVAAVRHHRWARGDWQLLPWILGRGPMPAIGRWKMIDNLRRTLSPPMAVVALFGGWAMPFGDTVIWTSFILSTIIVPTLLPVVGAIPYYRPRTTFESYLRALASDLRLALGLSALIVTLLAAQACLMADAILRTLWRLSVTRMQMLEWVPAAAANSSPRLDLGKIYSRMWGAPAIGLAATIEAFLSGSDTGLVIAPFALLWLLSPAVARWISLSPTQTSLFHVSDDDAKVLRLAARRTWRFFETFVTAADHMLPPDNFQEIPSPVLAHRTSPTNLGLYLLSVTAAHDFGWIGRFDAIDRLEATLETMTGLPKFRGHLYNWYDTTDLRPLDPHYISSVDSGNLAGHLIALANACRMWRETIIDPAAGLRGISDAIELSRREVDRLDDGHRTELVAWADLDRALTELESIILQCSVTPRDIKACFVRLADHAATMGDIARALSIERADGNGVDMLFWVEACLAAIASHRRDLQSASSAESRLLALENTARSMAMAMEFDFLLDPDRKLLSIGYLVTDGAQDINCYDLLASEARLASFFAIAKGDVPARHWFRLGRAVTPVVHGGALISWSGSMFEYLMPSLVMRAPVGSLLEQTSRLIVRRQIDYATRLRLPWGISESAYNARDLEFTYQYSNFGIPGLGLKRGLGENFVIAPYATALAAMVDPRAASCNLERLAGIGACGRYGFYEALDYTPRRLPGDETVAIVQAYMAHHQGMTIVAVADALLNGIMRTRFHSDPMVQATELLLQERTPREVSVARPWLAEAGSAPRIREGEPSGARHFTTPHQPTPATQLLSNGQYTVMITAAGSGYSRWGNIAVTRWREDATCDDSGSYVFIRDVRSGEVWSAGFQPSGVEPDSYDVSFTEDRAEFTRHDRTLSTTLDVLVSTENDAEVRRVSISNTGLRTRECEITSYAELVLAPQSADVAHPAFSKLFVETEYHSGTGAILATRRKRTPTEPDIWAAHLMAIDGGAVGKAEFETDRARFLGRSNGIRTPIAMMDGRTLGNSVGTVLDPIFALRRRVRIPPGGTVRIAFWTMLASTREAVLNSVDKHKDTAAFSRAGTLVWTLAQVQLYHLGITASEASLFQRLAGHVIFASPALRPASTTILQGCGAQPGLWAQGISGDQPIVLLRISDTDNLDVARELLQAHEYWRLKQLSVDLVILNERKSSYVQDLQVAIETMVRASQARNPIGDAVPPGRIYVLRTDLIPPETASLLAAVARIVLVAQRGSLSDQLKRLVQARVPGRFLPRRGFVDAERQTVTAGAPDLEFFNGLGGFGQGGTEYVTIFGPGQSTPAPWINVIANPAFGFQVSAEGGGYTWSANSRENQMTPWSNDPVTDRTGEALYLRDEETGDLWSPTCSPIRNDRAIYKAHHGRGYSRFEHVSHGVESSLLQFVPIDHSIKISRLVLHNRSNRTRFLSVTAYVEWVLGTSRSSSLPFVTTGMDGQTGAMLARNPWNAAFGGRVAFIDMKGDQTDWTGDRREFIGRNGTLANPVALASALPLSKTVGAGLDPCGAMRTKVRIPPNGSIEVTILLGQAASAEDAQASVLKYRAADLDAALNAVTRYWDDVTGRIQVKTPDRSMDIMLNGWLLYQTLACRVWARSAFYQASGAYGFRDQLQDGMALAASRPELTREHLLRAAARQFAEGDMLHWWLPHSGQGVRTRISDDRAWLAYTVAQYVAATGDGAVLDEAVPFLEGPELKEGQDDNFFLPEASSETATLFEHCARALDHSLAVGQHGLPLMGTGDWNDGMNRVGEGGKGESVWLGWFLYTALTRFLPLASARGELERVTIWRKFANSLKAALDREAWDGEWYRRGFFDDGTAFGSAASDECRIDSIAQSWAVLSQAGKAERALQSMGSLERLLIRPADQLALLFTPPFDRTALDPGYIKGYPPGIRENGGQYTHAALWSVMAFAALGEGDKASSLFAMLNPINHARTRAGVLRYKVEPYVVAADIYSKAPHVGRGGWTWYTGSAGWMQRAGVESILGLVIEGDTLKIDPCIPREWPGFDVTLRHGAYRYDIHVENTGGMGRGISFASVDDQPITQRPLRVKMQDDGMVHSVLVRLGS
jgi:cyclic beta-1,2-glucan synthetase